MAIKQTIPFNFDENYAYVEQKFIEKGYDVQVGSNTMQLATAMSYLVSMLNANTAVNVNETLLTLARKRKNILHDARNLGYEIVHRTSYKYEILLNFTTIGAYTLPEYTYVSDGTHNYYYLGADFSFNVSDITTTHYYCDDITQLQSDDLGATWDSTLKIATFPTLDGLAVDHNNVTTISGTVTGINSILKSYLGELKRVEVSEGNIHRYVDNPTTLVYTMELGDAIDEFTGEQIQRTQYYVDIPYTNIENDGIHAYLSYIDANGNYLEKEAWEKSDNYIIESDTVLEKQFVRLDNIDTSTPRIYFKLGNIGTELRPGTIVYVNILETNGSEGAITGSLSPMNNISLVSSVLNYFLVSEGAEEETDNSIKINAPLLNNTANRVITTPDYRAFLNRESSVKLSQVWDGKSEYPTKPGYIWFSFTPATITRTFTQVNPQTNSLYQLDIPNDSTNWYLEPTEVSNIVNKIENYNVPTIRYHNRNPVYFDFLFEIQIINYNVSKTIVTQNENVFNSINSYFNNTTDTKAESFEFEYFNSNLLRRLDATLTDISGINVTLTNNIDIDINDLIQETPVLNVSDEIVGYNKEVRVHLGLPFENVLSGGVIDTTLLPQIDTLNFVSTDALTVDFNNPTEIIPNPLIQTEVVTTYPISLGAVVIGSYKVFDYSEPDIEIVLQIVDGTGIGHTNGINQTDLETILTFDITYPSPNFRFSRNTIPRLREVKFI